MLIILKKTAVMNFKKCYHFNYLRTLGNRRTNGNRQPPIGYESRHGLFLKNPKFKETLKKNILHAKAI